MVALDLIELGGDDLRRSPIEYCKRKLVTLHQDRNPILHDEERELSGRQQH
jgi:hypothetical protein